MLPLEIWREIAFCSSLAYYVLAQVCRGIAIPPDLAKRKFLIHTINDNGHYTTLPCGQFHSIDDEPAINTDIMCKWYRDGLLHRDNDLPAVIEVNGNQMWYKNGRLHRDNDLPAADGVTGLFWYSSGMLHRIGGPAILLRDGQVFWYEQGRQIRYRPHGWLFA